MAEWSASVSAMWIRRKIMFQEISYEVARFRVMSMLPNTLVQSAQFEIIQNHALQHMVYTLSAAVAQKRIREETREVLTVLSWKQRIKALFGGTIPTKIEIRQYRNCQHLPTESDRKHIAFLVNDLTASDWGR